MKFNGKKLIPQIIVVVALAGLGVWGYGFGCKAGNGGCGGGYEKFVELFEAKDVEALIAKGNKLMKKGYQEDIPVLTTMATAFYAKDEKQKAADLLDSSFRGKYLCELSRPSDKFTSIDEAQRRYMLHLIYKELDLKDKAKAENDKAEVLIKKHYGDEYKEEKHKKFVNLCVEALNHFKE